MKQITAIIIGSGQAGKAHLEAARRLGFINVLGMVSSSPERTREISQKRDLASYFPNWQEAVSHPAVDAVHVCAPNHWHYPMISAALAAGKHVLSEKPLTVSVAEAEELHRLAEEKQLVHGVMFNYRMYPLIQAARQYITAGAIGEIISVRGHYLQDWLMAGSDTWRLDPQRNGPYGALADIGSHYFDLLEYLTGLRINRVFACSGQLKAGAYAVRADILYRLDNGAAGICAISQASPGHSNDLGIEVEGAKASLTWRQERPEELIIGYGRGIQVIQAKTAKDGPTDGIAGYPPGHIEGWPDGVKNLMRQFYTAVRVRKYGTEQQPAAWRHPTFADGERSVRLVNAIYDSTEKGSWVEVVPGEGLKANSFS